MAECKTCGEEFSNKRAALGYTLCLPCGEREARGVKHCTVPGHKQGYMVVSNKADLIGINNKTIR